MRDSLPPLTGERDQSPASLADERPVSRDYIMTVRRAIWAETLCFQWQKGDVMLIDNFRFSHGRSPFSGDRKIFATLISPFY